MCHCSNLTQESSNNNEKIKSIDALLNLVHDLVSNDKGLKKQLPFTIKRKSDNAGSARGGQREVGKRIAKIFSYDPTQFTKNLLLSNNCDRWLKEPASFLQVGKVRHDHIAVKPQHSAIISILQLQQQDSHSRILRRFYCVVLHRLRASSCKNEGAEAIAKAIYPSLQTKGDLEQLTASIQALLHAGQRYELLVQEFGIGALFILGDEISNSVWEKWLPIKGDLWNQVKQYLTSMGLKDHGEGFNGLGYCVIDLITRELPSDPCTFIPFTNSNDGANSQIKAKRRRPTLPTESSSAANPRAKIRKCDPPKSNQASKYGSVGTMDSVQDDVIPTLDKDEESRTSHIGTVTRTDTFDKEFNVHALLRAAEHIEEESNTVVEDHIQINSTCEAEPDDNLSWEPCVDPEIVGPNWQPLFDPETFDPNKEPPFDLEMASRDWQPLFNPGINSPIWQSLFEEGGDPTLQPQLNPGINSPIWQSLFEEGGDPSFQPQLNSEINGPGWQHLFNLETDGSSWEPLFDTEKDGVVWQPVFSPELQDVIWKTVFYPNLEEVTWQPVFYPELKGVIWQPFVPESASWSVPHSPQSQGGITT